MNRRDEPASAWNALVEAAHIGTPDDTYFESAYARYRDEVGHSRTNSDVSAMRSPAPRHRSLAWAAGIAAVAVVAAPLFATLDGADVTDTASSSRDPARESPAERVSATPPIQVIEVAGSETTSRSAAYGASTFEEFTRSSLIDDVVEGTVTDSVPVVIGGEDDAEVLTRLTVAVKQSRQRAGAATMTVLQHGGVVTKRDMRRYLESTFGRLDEKELDDLVEVRPGGHVPHRTGASVLLAIDGGTGSGPVVIESLTAASDGFVWAAAPPNAAWSPSLDRSEVDALFR
ncbi:hypothetical protein H9L21_13255 [Aeromicrobium senzhongii]|uniref:Uncharacterized protein n=1 Tax=Aeromicrobium senzhongii TaxID=2663859 RepID=A0ABX6STK0_9ACTN|nr:hypothetical protein [Aeromicrobium senzhongii]MTB88652.1 hypothetical protein [Aeromicrobium senzhongii]QNL94045.1 hypothetical protein H9L21_13255 [Aeromicrobium senzhongii]